MGGLVLKLYFSYIVILSFFFGCGKPINDTERIISRADVDMDSMRWDMSSFPLSIKIAQNLDLRSQAVASAALDEWERGANIDFFTALETTSHLNFSRLSDYYYRDKSTNGIYLSEIPVDELQAPNLAVTQIIFFTNTEIPSKPFYEILHADIVINGYDYEFSSSPFENGAYYLLTLILHEVGHVLGLGHHNDGIMYPSMSVLDKQETLTDFDKSIILEKYRPGINPGIPSNWYLGVNSTSDLKIVRLYLPDSKVLPGLVIRKKSRL